MRIVSSIASNGSEGTTAGRMVSTRSTMMLHCFRNKKARRAINQDIDYPKQCHIPHCWLSAKVMYPANSTKSFSWLTRSTPIFIVEEHSSIICIYIYICICVCIIGNSSQAILCIFVIKYHAIKLCSTENDLVHVKKTLFFLRNLNLPFRLQL